MTRKVNILENVQTWTSATDFKTLTIGAFKEVKALYVNGNKMEMMTEDEIVLNSDNVKHSGTPTKFYIETGYSGVAPVYKVIYNVIPSSTVKVKLYYWALAETNATGPTVPGQFHTDLCYYAIAQVTAKSNPDFFKEYTALWSQAIMSINSESSDRDLIYDIKEEI